ncbi:hypothetical protein [Aequorivita echinoideorum]|uniref:Uncharacterized protein n=1 Tax=Aequorivita echinoideorum TaxID=1549647 RepID=A0ABS5S5J2_9FLAO|nr:hypothetical protein [Aequorivita echinoideorum]MBT0607632.1 hypothetical protein [Aequorivita echinoideorum]
MANETILIDDVQKELNTYLANNPKLISASMNRAEITLDKHTKPITKIKGAYPQAHTLLTNVVQGFKPEWNELGKAQIAHKILKDYHQKVNFPLIPAEILHSYFADLYAEDKDMKDMPISKYIIENELIPKTIENMDWLSINGVYDPLKLEEFGFSMNGIDIILQNMLGADVAAANPADSHTAFKIPMNALTDTNMVAQVTTFERKLPTKFKKKGIIKKIFMSENNVERYQLDYEDKFGESKFNNDVMKTRLGKREIVGLPGWDSDLIFATTENNFRRLIDVFDEPKVTDIQKQDYKLKIFMEFWKGYDFLINEMVFISNYEDATYGLGSADRNQSYFDIEGVTVEP